jgi:hypothetical protein
VTVFGREDDFAAAELAGEEVARGVERSLVVRLVVG